MITKLSEKYDRVLRYCEKEVDKITKMFKRQREDPPLPRNYSPVAGKIELQIKQLQTQWKWKYMLCRLSLFTK